jgi:uncharacterized RDD family membrane protein YckC
MDDSYRIDTPENVTFGYEISGLGSRFLAALVDTLVIVILLVVMYMVTIAFLVSPPGKTLSQALGDWIIAGYALFTFAILWGYYIFFEMIWNGQSLGKRWLGVRVIRTDGMPITLVESVVRNLVRVVDFLPVYYGFGVVTMMISAQSRRLGDLAAGTVVVKERKDVTLSALGRAAAPVSVHLPELIESMGDPTVWPLERLTDEDMYIIKEFLTRRQGLMNRSTLAIRLAAQLCARLDLTPPSGAWARQACETFLEQVAALDSARP